MRACVRDDSVRCVTWQRQTMCQRYCVAHASNVLSRTTSVIRMFVVPYGVAAGDVTSSSTSSSSPSGEHPPCYYFIYILCCEPCALGRLMFEPCKMEHILRASVHHADNLLLAGKGAPDQSAHLVTAAIGTQEAMLACLLGNARLA